MSDLCHNCGDCHLGAQAIKCRKELQECIICRCYGHTYNFCPRSVHSLDEKYSYFMLCHNCDSWHLPKPCDNELTHCERCHQYGHMVFFCPIDPEPRARTNEQVGAKRQRSQDGGHDWEQSRYAPVTEVQQVHPQLLRDIKLHAVNDALALLDNYSKADVLTYFARPVLPPLQTMTGLVQQTVAPAAQQFGGSNEISVFGSSTAAGDRNGNVFDQGSSHHLVEQPTHGSPTMLPTPASATDARTSIDQGKAAPGVYQTMHDRFERGELAMTQDMQQEPHSDSATHSPAPGSVDTQPTPAGKKKATPKNRRPIMRCAPCKKRHMKCKHFDEDGNPTVPGVQPAPRGSVNELPSTKDLVYEPSVGKMVSREQQDTIRPGSGKKQMQSQVAGTDQTVTGDLPEFDQTQRSFQGGIHQLDWLSKSKEHAQSAFVMENESSSMMPDAMGDSQHWMGSGGMLSASGMYGQGDQVTAANQQLERNLAQMLSEEAGFGLPQSTVELMTFGGNAAVAIMGTDSLPVPETDAEVVAHADGGGTPDVDASVEDLVEPPKKKRGGGRKRTKAA